MKYRDFGRTGLKVSETGFGAWAIGGAYGKVDRQESLRALARAQELGCNFVDTAAVYGDSEDVLGEFLRGRRQQWLVATKYSGQAEGIESTLDNQLRKLGTDCVDLYQIHWAPHSPEPYQQLEKLRASGKARFVGVSLYNEKDIDYVLKNTTIDSIQLPFSLLDPNPYLARLQAIRDSGIAVIIRSCLKEGFLTGKFTPDTRFDDPADQRHTWTRQKIAELVELSEQFRFIEKECDSMLLGAARYPLAFRETSTLILGTKTVTQADLNFGSVPATQLSPALLETIAQTQARLRLGQESGIAQRTLGKLVRIARRLLAQ
jgi:aryl-alcohol dehydrogenase-like predicted oxidoreductase